MSGDSNLIPISNAVIVLTKDNKKTNFYTETHNMSGFNVMVSQLAVGKGRKCYGRTTTLLNGIMMENYMHFESNGYYCNGTNYPVNGYTANGGVTIFNPSILFSSFHVV